VLAPRPLPQSSTVSIDVEIFTPPPAFPAITLAGAIPPLPLPAGLVRNDWPPPPATVTVTVTAVTVTGALPAGPTPAGQVTSWAPPPQVTAIVTVGELRPTLLPQASTRGWAPPTTIPPNFPALTLAGAIPLPPLPVGAVRNDWPPPPPAAPPPNFPAITLLGQIPPPPLPQASIRSEWPAPANAAPVVITARTVVGEIARIAPSASTVTGWAPPPLTIAITISSSAIPTPAPSGTVTGWAPPPAVAIRVAYTQTSTPPIVLLPQSRVTPAGWPPPPPAPPTIVTLDAYGTVQESMTASAHEQMTATVVEQSTSAAHETMVATVRETP
jgi:hypothetical protein